MEYTERRFRGRTVRKTLMMRHYLSLCLCRPNLSIFPQLLYKERKGTRYLRSRKRGFRTAVLDLRF